MKLKNGEEAETFKFSRKVRSIFANGNAMKLKRNGDETESPNFLQNLNLSSLLMQSPQERKRKHNETRMKQKRNCELQILLDFPSFSQQPNGNEGDWARNEPDREDNEKLRGRGAGTESSGGSGEEGENRHFTVLLALMGDLRAGSSKPETKAFGWTSPQELGRSGGHRFGGLISTWR